MYYQILANDKQIKKTTKSLKSKGYETIVVENAAEALEEIKKAIPEDASIMNGSSTTLAQIGFIDLLKSHNHKWKNLHEVVLAESDPHKQALLRKQSLLADYYIGSVHALQEDGTFMVASNTGSQLPHIVYSSQNLVFVVSTKKIVRDMAEGLARLEEHIYPLEDKRMQEAYGIGTNLNKIVVFRGENPNNMRKIKFIIVKEDLGF
jgi:L-lactate utilization protein LutC